jgi:hypothetical protein
MIHYRVATIEDIPELVKLELHFYMR